MNRNVVSNILKALTVGIIFCCPMVPRVFADIAINVVAVNGTDMAKTSTIHFDLPGELTAEDVLDTNGLKLDYDVENGNYFVYGDVTLKSKESKTFRISVRDEWMVSAGDVADLKKQIEQGYETLGKPYNDQNAQILKDRLDSKLDYIMNLQSTNADSIDKRIDIYRTYTKEMKRIQNDALDVNYWRSDPNNDETPKVINLTVDVSNPTKILKSAYKIKDYLPAEVKPEDVVDDAGFEVRYDPIRQLSFLFKEEDLAPGQDKKYTIGVLDIWNIPKNDIDYLRKRANNAYNFLLDTKFEDSAKILLDRIMADLQDIEASQAISRPILDNISAYRANKVTYNNAEKDVETLEKLLSVFREDLQKSKVENVLQKIQSLKGVSDVSKVMFNKKFETSTAWSFIGWILLFVGLLTLINFVVWLLRSKDKKINGTTEKK